MPLSTIKIAPGVNAEITDAQGMAQITSSQLIRFKFAGNEVLPEKLGGWQKFYPLALGSVPRDLHAWEGINNDTHLAAGCEQSLNIITDGVLQNVTPRTQTTNNAPNVETINGNPEVTINDPGITVSAFDSIYILTPISIGGIILQGPYAIETVLDADSYTIIVPNAPTATAGPGGDLPEFATTIDSAFVNVELADHGYVVGQVFAIPTPTTVGGITLQGAYLVQAVVDVDNFTIISSVTAASTDTEEMNAGDAQIVYYIGLAPSPTLAGYGTGGYGAGGYGTGIVPPTTPGTPIVATNWTLDNWGEVLIATPANQSIYTWSPDSGFPVAVRIVDAPLINGGAFVAQPAQILVAWASSQGGVQDPLSIMWADAGDYTNWAVTSQTQAGGFRLPTGSKIVGGGAGPNFNIIWTDVDCWSMDYIEPPLVFGFNNVGTNCGLLCRHGWAILNSVVYWISNNTFCRLRGETVETIPCSIWDVIFQDLDTDNVDKIHAGSNSLFGELVWYYPSRSGGTGDCDSYAKYNPLLNTWDYGRLPRTAWIDQSPVGPPVGASPAGLLFQHEVSPDADGQPLVSWFQTGFWEIADGDQLQFVDWIFPDFKWGLYNGDQQAVVNITFRYGDYPNSVTKMVGPLSFTKESLYQNPRLRGRYVGIMVQSEDLGSFWRLGAVKIRSAPDGRL